MLFTAHADCQKGIEKMINYFDWYYTTNSRKHPDYGYDNFTMFDFSVWSNYNTHQLSKIFWENVI